MTRRRATLGVTVGLIVAILGPIGSSVASHSGNEGPARGYAKGSAAIRHGSQATWVTRIGGVTKTYTFGVWSSAFVESATGGIYQESASGVKGGSYATLRSCGTTCTTTTMRGPSGVGEVSPPASARYSHDPALGSAAFNGALAKADGSGYCSFTVTWTATSEPQHAASNPVTGSRGTLVGEEVWRQARASLRSNCWPALSNGGGTIWRAIGIDALVDPNG